MTSSTSSQAHPHQQPPSQDFSLPSTSLGASPNPKRPSSPVPSPVLTVAGPAVSVHRIWHNPHTNTTTYQTSDDRVIKHHQPVHPYHLSTSTSTSLLNEAARTRWAATYLPNRVPEILDARTYISSPTATTDPHTNPSTAPTTTYLLTSTLLPGDPASHPNFQPHPTRTIHALGRALRHLHDTLPPDTCPWSFSPSTRIHDAHARSLTVPASLHTPPFPIPAPDDALVVCHGDACCPNFLLPCTTTSCPDPRGAATPSCAYVDLGQLGVADRWADIAVLAWSVDLNFGPGWEAAMLAGYGVRPDAGRMAYYRALFVAW